MVVYAQPDDEERFWLLLLTVISPRKLDGIWFNRDSEGFYSSGDRCKIFWKKIIRPGKMLETIYVVVMECSNNCKYVLSAETTVCLKIVYVHNPYKKENYRFFPWYSSSIYIKSRKHFCVDS